MTASKRQTSGQIYLIWLTTAITVVSAVFIFILAILAYTKMPTASAFDDSDFIKAEEILSRKLPPDEFKIAGILLANHVKKTDLSAVSSKQMMTFLMWALVLILLLLLSQAYMWNRDRRRLELWQKSGFLCERLEFLPADRLKINDTELELNKTQIENLKKIARSRQQGKPIHALDIGDHGVQSIKRLREELGAKFIEKNLIKIRKREGYWLEVEAGSIHGIPE